MRSSVRRHINIARIFRCTGGVAYVAVRRAIDGSQIVAAIKVLHRPIRSAVGRFENTACFSDDIAGFCVFGAENRKENFGGVCSLFYPSAAAVRGFIDLASVADRIAGIVICGAVDGCEIV